MTRGIILPEMHYDYTPAKINDIRKAFCSKEPITGIVESVSIVSDTVIVKLGDSLYGYLPFSEVTIYPLTNSRNPNDSVPVQISSILYKKIRVHVTGINEKNEVMLSRKKNMQQSFNTLRLYTHLNFYVTKVYPTSAYGDVGDGIYGMIPKKEFSNCPVKSVAEFCHSSSCFLSTVIDCDDVYSRFLVSYKRSFPEYDQNNFQIGNPIAGTIREPVDDICSGYFVEIDPQISAIMDRKPWHPAFHYGTKVNCTIKGVTSKGLRIKFTQLAN